MVVAGQPIEVGDEPCMLFTFADLEPRRKAETALRHSEERFAKAHSPRCVENVGWNQRTPEAEFAGWRDSPTHARNLLDPGIRRMGIGIQDRYVAFFACR